MSKKITKTSVMMQNKGDFTKKMHQMKATLHFSLVMGTLHVIIKAYE